MSTNSLHGNRLKQASVAVPRPVPSTEGPRQPLLCWPVIVVASGLILAVVFGLSMFILSSPRSAADGKVEAAVPAATLAETPPPRLRSLAEVPVVARTPAPAAAAPAPAPVREPSAASAEAAACSVDGPAACGAPQTYGTSVAFLGSPEEAARQAKQEQKLVYVIHISGNFEDSRFT
jgi:hypothetical protein